MFITLQTKHFYNKKELSKYIFHYKNKIYSYFNSDMK